MPKILISLVLLSLCCGIYADEIDDKIQQLRQLEQQLESAQQKAKQTETKKKQTQTEITKAATLKRRTDEALKKLSFTEAVVKDSISAVNRRLKNVNDNLSILDDQINDSLGSLLRIKHQNSPTAPVRKDAAYIKDVIRQVKLNQDILSGFRVMLAHDFEQRRREHGRLSRDLRSTRTQSVTYDKRIKNLQVQDQKLTQEQRALQAQIDKLRTDAAALETLIARLAAESGKESASYQFSTRKIPWPVRGKVIRAYGEETKSYGTSIVNNGIDIAVNEGTNVQVIDDGEVVFADRYGGQGRLIIVDHKNGFFSVYAYNSELLVSRNDKVKKGQTIAKSGMSGSATQPSLRFELRRDGKAVNPMNYLE